MTPAAKNDDDKKRDKKGPAGEGAKGKAPTEATGPTEAQRKDLERLAQRATGDPSAKVGSPAGKAGGESEGPASRAGAPSATARRPEARATTAPTRSRCSRASRRCAAVPACTSATPPPAACTTWSTRSSTTASTRPWPASASTSTSGSPPDEGILVTDDGRGIPVDEVPGQGLPGVTVAFTKLHAGGKFDNGAYKVSGGLHGVGASVVNALSELLRGRGPPERARSGSSPSSAASPRRSSRSAARATSAGPRSTSSPTGRSSRSSSTTTARSCRGCASWRSSTRASSIGITDERTDPPKEEHFQYDGGIREFVKWLNEGKDVLHNDVIYVEREADGVAVEIAMQYNNGFNPVEQSFANNIHTLEGGTHLSGFRTALTRRLAEYARREKFFGPEEKPSGDNFREGLTAVISVKVREPQFEGQTKTKLGNSEVEGIVASAFGDALASYLEENPKTARQILEKAVLAYRAWEAARKAKDLVRRKGALASGNLPGKLADCSEQGPRVDRAVHRRGRVGRRHGQEGRDRATQAILPLRGKILNVEKARLDKMLGHEEIRTLITAVGTGIGRGRRRRGLRPHEAALRQDHHHDRRRRRRQPHPHAAAHVPLPPHAAAHRGGARVRGAAAALQDRQEEDRGVRLRGEGAEGPPPGARQREREVRAREGRPDPGRAPSPGSWTRSRSSRSRRAPSSAAT